MKLFSQLLLLVSLAVSTAASAAGRISTIEITQTPAITAALYASGQQLGALQTLDVGVERGSSATLLDLSVVDLDKQKAPIDILFFSVSPTFTNAEHVALAMSNANALTLIGGVSIAAANYRDTAAQSVATINNIWQILKPVGPATKVYAVAVSRGTPTYTTTSSLKFVYHVEQN